jgi:hypothetical protein
MPPRSAKPAHEGSASATASSATRAIPRLRLVTASLDYLSQSLDKLREDMTSWDETRTVPSCRALLRLSHATGCSGLRPDRVPGRSGGLGLALRPSRREYRLSRERPSRGFSDPRKAGIFPAPWHGQGASGVSGDFAQQELEKKKLPSPYYSRVWAKGAARTNPLKSPNPPYGLFSSRVSGASSLRGRLRATPGWVSGMKRRDVKGGLIPPRLSWTSQQRRSSRAAWLQLSRPRTASLRPPQRRAGR